MSLKATETVYNAVIDNVIKEITDDPQMNSISTEAIEYLGRTWRSKLQETGVYTPPATEYPKHLPGQLHIPIHPKPGYNMGGMVPSSTTEQDMRMYHQYPPNYYPAWIPPQGFPREMMQHYNPAYRIYEAKATLTSGSQPIMPHPMGNQHFLMDQYQASQQNMMNMNDKMQQNKKEPAKNTINIKTEPNRDEDEQQNNSKLPVRVPTNGSNQGTIDITGTPKRTALTTETTTPNKDKDKDTRSQREDEEEEKKDNVFQSDADDEEEGNDEAADEGGDEGGAAAPEEDDDDARLFEYEVNDKPDVPQLKEEHIPPPIQPAVQVPVNIGVNELDPYNPQDRPLDSDDDPDYGELSEATDILIAFHEKVHRHGTKWKVTLKQGIMNAKGKEYILSQITGDFDFM